MSILGVNVSEVKNALKILWIENSKNVAESDSIFVDQTNSSLISSLHYWYYEYNNLKKKSLILKE